MKDRYVLPVAAAQAAAPSPLLDETEAAKLLNCSVALLRRWRLFHSGPAFMKIGRLVRYSVTDLNAYIDASRRN